MGHFQEQNTAFAYCLRHFLFYNTACAQSLPIVKPDLPTVKPGRITRSKAGNLREEKYADESMLH